MKNEDVNTMSWKTGKLLFQDKALESIVHDLSRHYQQVITIKSDALKATKLSTSFDNQPLEEVIEIIKSTLDIQAEQGEGGSIILTKP